VAAIGKIPPDEAKKFPNETLLALKFDRNIFDGKGKRCNKLNLK
jgi:hypothetical protein